MIMPFSADNAYQTVKRGMSMIRAIKAGQILYAYASSTGAVVDADTVLLALQRLLPFWSCRLAMSMLSSR